MKSSSNLPLGPFSFFSLSLVVRSHDFNPHTLSMYTLSIIAIYHPLPIRVIRLKFPLFDRKFNVLTTTWAKASFGGKTEAVRWSAQL